MPAEEKDGVSWNFTVEVTRVHHTTQTNFGPLRPCLPSMSLLVPGQPVPIPRGPAPQLGPGTYSRDNQVRSSVLGVPRFQGSVCISAYLALIKK